MTLSEYIQKELTDNNTIFQTQAFRDGLTRYRNMYDKDEKDRLLLDRKYPDPKDTLAVSAAMLGCLHDEYLTDTPIASGLPDSFKEYLVNRFNKKRLDDIDSVWGRTFKNTVQLAIAQFKITEMQVDWIDDAPDYITGKDAVELSNESISPVQLSKACKPDGDIRYMRKGQRCKVHIADFMRHIKPVDHFSENDMNLLARHMEKEKDKIRKDRGF